VGCFEHLVTLVYEEVSHLLLNDGKRRSDRTALVIIFKYKQVKDSLCACLLY